MCATSLPCETMPTYDVTHRVRVDGCHLLVVPPGQRHRRPITPKSDVCESYFFYCAILWNLFILVFCVLNLFSISLVIYITCFSVFFCLFFVTFFLILFIDFTILVVSLWCSVDNTGCQKKKHCHNNCFATTINDTIIVLVEML